MSVLGGKRTLARVIGARSSTHPFDERSLELRGCSAVLPLLWSSG
jgi:hypothetical protein